MAHILLPTEAVVSGAAALTTVAAMRLVRAISAGLFAYLGLRLRLRTAVQLAETHPGVGIEVTNDGVVISPAPTGQVPPAADTAVEPGTSTMADGLERDNSG